MSLRTLASLDRNAAPDYFSPYNVILTSINVPSSSTNFGPANVQILSLQSAVSYALCISQANISMSFNAAIIKAILTESLDTTNKNVIGEGAVDMCPHPNSCAYFLKFSPSLISNII